MKNRLIFLIPAALLLITTSVYAQVDSDFEQEFNNFNSQARQNFDSFTQQAQEEFNNFSNQLNDTVKQQQEKEYKEHIVYPHDIKINHAPNYDKTPDDFPCQDNDIECVCGNDKYCKTNIKILKRLTKWTVVVTILQNKENQKQYLYEEKWELTDSTRSDLIAEVEKSEIQELHSFKQIQDYVTDMPLTVEGLRFALRRMQLYTKDSEKEEGVFIQALVKAIENSKDCPKDLNVSNYGLDTFCILP